MKRQNVKRILAAIVITSMAATMIAGCGNNNEAAKETGAKEQLVVWVRDTTSACVEDAAKKYNETHADVEVKVLEQVNTQMADQLSLALSANEAPDIVALDCTKVPYFSSIGAFVDISDKYEALDFKDEFSPGMVSSGQVDGTTYAVPFAPDVSVLLYNKDHYIDAGLDPDAPPTTWDELIDYSQKLTNDDHYGYVYAGGHPGAYMFTIMPYVWNNGGEFLSEDGKTCELDSDNAMAAMELFNDLTNTYKVTPPSSVTYSWGEAQDAFLTGKASQIVLGSAAVYNFVNGTSDMNWGACLIPMGPNGTEYASFSGGDSIGITTQCKNVDAAWDFIEYALSDDVQIEEFAKGGLLPARSDQFDNEYFNSTPEYQVLKEALEVGHTPYAIKYDEMYDPILTQMQNYLNGKLTVEEAVELIKPAIEEIVK